VNFVTCTSTKDVYGGGGGGCQLAEIAYPTWFQSHVETHVESCWTNRAGHGLSTLWLLSSHSKSILTRMFGSCLSG
jgi:hypothetical protein